jgi:hypothetical protein
LRGGWGSASKSDEKYTSNIDTYDLKDAPWYGCFTFLATYKPSKSPFLTALLRFGSVAAVLVQIVFLGHLLNVELQKERLEGLCLGNADVGTKFLMSTIAALIGMRTVQRGLDIWIAYARFVKLRAASPLGLRDTWLFPLMQADLLWQLCVNSFSYALNLGLVFFAQEPMEMVFNSVAVEFVANIDDEHKAWALGLELDGSDPAAALTARELERLWVAPAPGSPWAYVCAAARSSFLSGAVEAFAALVTVGASLLALFMVFYGHACKPGPL